MLRKVSLARVQEEEALLPGLSCSGHSPVAMVLWRPARETEQSAGRTPSCLRTPPSLGSSSAAAHPQVLAK